MNCTNLIGRIFQLTLAVAFAAAGWFLGTWAAHSDSYDPPSASRSFVSQLKPACPALEDGQAPPLHVDRKADSSTVQAAVNAGQITAHLSADLPGKTLVAMKSTVHGAKLWCRTVGDTLHVEGPGVTAGEYKVTATQEVSELDVKTLRAMFKDADVLAYTNTYSHGPDRRWVVGLKTVKATS